jgi:hypothetical protein
MKGHYRGRGNYPQDYIDVNQLNNLGNPINMDDYAIIRAELLDKKKRAEYGYTKNLEEDILPIQDEEIEEVQGNGKRKHKKRLIGRKPADGYLDELYKIPYEYTKLTGNGKKTEKFKKLLKMGAKIGLTAYSIKKLYDMLQNKTIKPETQQEFIRRMRVKHFEGKGAKYDTMEGCGIWKDIVKTAKTIEPFVRTGIKLYQDYNKGKAPDVNIPQPNPQQTIRTHPNAHLYEPIPEGLNRRGISQQRLPPNLRQEYSFDNPYYGMQQQERQEPPYQFSNPYYGMQPQHQTKPHTDNTYFNSQSDFERAYNDRNRLIEASNKKFREAQEYEKKTPFHPFNQWEALNFYDTYNPLEFEGEPKLETYTNPIFHNQEFRKEQARQQKTYEQQFNETQARKKKNKQEREQRQLESEQRNQYLRNKEDELKFERKNLKRIEQETEDWLKTIPAMTTKQLQEQRQQRYVIPELLKKTKRVKAEPKKAVKLAKKDIINYPEEEPKRKRGRPRKTGIASILSDEDEPKGVIRRTRKTKK